MFAKGASLLRSLVRRLCRRLLWISLVLSLAGCAGSGLRNEDLAATEPQRLGEMVVTESGQSEQAELFRQWIRRLEQKHPAEIRVVFPTEEGDPVVHTLSYNGTAIEYTIDNSADSFAGENRGVRRAVCGKLVQRAADRHDEYWLEQCRDDGAETDSPGRPFYLRLARP
jgi:hypothetical protein